jgi:FSR family fosmidomycin resistance protein-like MFS transporter
MTEVSAVRSLRRAVARPSAPSRTLLLAGLAHALHDGYTDTIYVLLPVWQSEFALGYGALALLRGLYAGAMAALQLPAGRVAERLGGVKVLALGAALAAVGYMLAGFSTGLLGLCAALVLSGIGSSNQHPIASAAVSRAYGAGARGPLGIYNFAGDLGKAAIPAFTSLLLIMLPWRRSLWLLALVGLLVAVLVALLLPPICSARTQRTDAAAGGGRGGFLLLFVIGVLDTGVRMGLLTFLPFVLKAKGAALPVIGIAFALVFIGGAAGKFVCGWFGGRFGVLRTVLLTEGATAACIVGVLILPLAGVFALLPLLGVMLNGTSSVFYGTVPELAPRQHAERAFALFYTGTIGSGALAPVLFGVLGDAVDPTGATVATAATALAIFPLALALGPHVEATNRNVDSA